MIDLNSKKEGQMKKIFESNGKTFEYATAATSVARVRRSALKEIIFHKKLDNVD